MIHIRFSRELGFEWWIWVLNGGFVVVVDGVVAEKMDQMCFILNGGLGS